MLNAVPPPAHPLASACCSGIVTATVTTTTPNSPSAATIAIIAIDVVVFSCEWFMSINGREHSYFKRFYDQTP